MKKEEQKQQQEAVETLRSSSSRRSTSEKELHSNKHINRSVANVGCMAGVFHLFSSKYYSRRKFLTFSASGKNNNKRTPARSRTRRSSSSSSSSNNNSPAAKQELPAGVINQSPINVDVAVAVPDVDVDVGVVQNNNTRARTVLNDYNDNRTISQEEQSKRSSLSSEDVVVSRSPTIPAGIRRRSTSLDLDSPKLGRQMPLVARLMGLQDHHHHCHYHSPTPPPPRPLLIQQQPTQSDDKRRKLLLGALEKCDENLNTLKKIVQEAVHVRSLSSANPNPGIKLVRPSNSSTCTEQPSPASVLDDFAGSSPTSSEGGHACHFPYSTTTSTTEPAGGRLISTQHQIQWRRTWSPGARSTMLIRPRRSSSYSPSITTTQLQQLQSLWSLSLSSKPQRSNGMMMKKKEIVEEVCRDVVWGQSWEVGRIGMVIEASVFRDLLEELAREMAHAHRRPRYSSLPFHTCKRKLHF